MMIDVGGAHGYVLHWEFDPPELLRAAHEVAFGQGWLSRVAASVAASLAAGPLELALYNDVGPAPDLDRVAIT